MARPAGCWSASARPEAGRLLDGLGLVERHAEALGDSVGDVGAAHEQDADEARDAALVDDDVGHVGPDVDQGLGAGRAEAAARGDEAAEHGEAGQVDGRRVQAGPLDGGERVADHVAGGGHEQHAQHPGAGLVGRLLERVEVQDRLLHRHRDEVLHLEGQARAELPGRQPRQVDLAHDHLLVGHADDDLLRAELRLRPELREGAGDRLDVDDLAVAHGAGRQSHLAEALEHRALACRWSAGPRGHRTCRCPVPPRVVLPLPGPLEELRPAGARSVRHRGHRTTGRGP